MFRQQLTQMTARAEQLYDAETLKVILSVYCVGESHNPTPQYVALT